MKRSGSRGRLDLSGAAIQPEDGEKRADDQEDGVRTATTATTATATATTATTTSPESPNEGLPMLAPARVSTPPILLPNQPPASLSAHFAVDIGGSLIKLGDGGVGGGRLHFAKFETSKLEECLDFIEARRLHVHQLNAAKLNDSVAAAGTATVKATGGGSYRFAEAFKRRLGLTLSKEDEMASLVAGANFLLRVGRCSPFVFVALGEAIEDEAFQFSNGEKEFVRLHGQLFPYLLVNIGSGVSMVDGEGDFARVSGTNLGGGTFWGLCRLLTKCQRCSSMQSLHPNILVCTATSFDEMLELSAKGNNATVDMLVGDIYGGVDYAKVGLSADTIASSFGKHGLKRIFFGGFFIRGHSYTMQTINFAINFWSKSTMKATFLRHEGFLGALGAFLAYEDDVTSELVHTSSAQLIERFPLVDGVGVSEAENVGTPPVNVSAAAAAQKVSWVEKFVQGGLNDQHAKQPQAKAVTSPKGDVAAALPPLHPVAPIPNINNIPVPPGMSVGVLHLDEREYWISVLLEHMPNLIEKAVESEGGATTGAARTRANAFAQAYQTHLLRLRAEPAAYGRPGLATLLEMREECLRDFNFHDAYKQVKDRENAAALSVLSDLLAELDEIADEGARLQALIEGVLAGNIFDWSGTILEIYRESRSMLRRPWLIDNFEAFRAKLLSGTPDAPAFKKALLFVDNSGADAVLGMLPLARELARRGAHVFMVLAVAVETTGDAVLKQALQPHTHDDNNDGSNQKYTSTGRLSVVESGHGSPCIDLRRVSQQLVEAAQGVDLIVLEGMGRALHTNFQARFTCDSLKLAMIKNNRLAARFNGKLYDCVCLYEAGLR
eukprot:jgi/Chlat1/3214/Chrsp22S03498